jgi:alkylhydroperoxidase family enzyme
LIEIGDHPSLNPQDKAILTYAVKLTRTPASISKEDIDLLRAQNLDDRGIHDICAITSYFAFVNRMADGLGIELEPRFSED